MRVGTNAEDVHSSSYELSFSPLSFFSSRKRLSILDRYLLSVFFSSIDEEPNKSQAISSEHEKVDVQRKRKEKV